MHFFLAPTLAWPSTASTTSQTGQSSTTSTWPSRGRSSRGAEKNIHNNYRLPKEKTDEKFNFCSLFEESVVDSPNVLMKVTERGGGAVDSAQVGDPLELR